MDPDLDPDLDVSINVGGDPGASVDGDISNSEVDADLLDDGLDAKANMGINVRLEVDKDLGDVEANLAIDIGNDGVGMLMEAVVVDKRAESNDGLVDDGLDGGNSLDLDVGLGLSLDIGIDRGSGLELKLVNIDLGGDKTTEDVGIDIEVNNNIGAKMDLDLVAGLDNGVNDDLGVQVNNSLDTVDTTLLHHRDSSGVMLGGGGLGGGEEGEGQDGGDESGDSHVGRKRRGWGRKVEVEEGRVREVEDGKVGREGFGCCGSCGVLLAEEQKKIIVSGC